MIRWHASVSYYTKAGSLLVEHDLEELSDLHAFIERGPHWDSIINIVVLKHRVGPALTVEQAEEL